MSVAAPLTVGSPPSTRVIGALNAFTEEVTHKASLLSVDVLIFSFLAVGAITAGG